MARAGRPLDLWQQDSITLMLAIRPDGKWACFEYCEWCSRQNGKGAVLEARALAGLFLLGEELIMWSAHEYKTAMEAFRRILVLLRRLGRKINDNLIEVDGILLKVINTNGEEGVERLDTNQRLKFIARSKSSGRGFSGDVVIIDESFAYTQVQQDALMPTLSARQNPQIVYTSSPPLTPETGEVMFLLRHRGDPGAPRDPEAPPWRQDDSLGYRDWGLPGDLDDLGDVDLDDAGSIAAANPGLSIRITMETVRRERRSMGASGFARERLGIWPRSAFIQFAWLVIPERHWTAAHGEWAAHASPVSFAVEVALDRSRAAVAVATRRSDGLRQIQLAALEPGTAWVVPWLAERVRKWRACAIVLDPGGPAGSLIAELEKRRVEVLKPTAREYAAACGAFVDGIAGAVSDGQRPEAVRDVRHTDQAPLNAAVAGLTLRNISETSVFEREGEGFLASAVALALWGHTVKAPVRKQVVNIW